MPPLPKLIVGGLAVAVPSPTKASLHLQKLPAAATEKYLHAASLHNPCQWKKQVFTLGLLSYHVHPMTLVVRPRPPRELLSLRMVLAAMITIDLHVLIPIAII